MPRMLVMFGIFNLLCYCIYIYIYYYRQGVYKIAIMKRANQRVSNEGIFLWVFCELFKNIYLTESFRANLSHWFSILITTVTDSYCVLAIIELFGYNFPFEKLSLTNLQPLDFFICWTLHLSWTASYEINLIRLSVRLSVRLFVRLSVCLSICQSARLSINKFFQDWIISFFSDIVHDDSWPWYLVTDEAIFLNKTFWWLKFWSNRPKLGQK